MPAIRVARQISSFGALVTTAKVMLMRDVPEQPEGDFVMAHQWQ